MWFYLALSAAVILGIYDISKKIAVTKNAVIPVLFLSVLFGAFVVIPPALLSITYPEMMKSIDLYVPPAPLNTHFFLFIKSLIVSSSWMLGYFAVKNLPITISTPIRSSGPFFTLIGALTIFHEMPSPLQWIGFVIIIVSFLFMSRIGKLEGINFRNNKWVVLMAGATLLSSCSSLYDKYLLQSRGFHPQLVLTWFSIYMVFIMGAVLLFIWYPKRKNYTKFQWKWSILLVGVLLVISDAFYFRALHDEQALIIIVSAVKRFRVFVAVIAGGLIFKENNKRKKSIALTGIITGVLIILAAKELGL